jgi:hypothetical protein
MSPKQGYGHTLVKIAQYYTKSNRSKEFKLEVQRMTSQPWPLIWNILGNTKIPERQYHTILTATSKSAVALIVQ